jgi:hypothetical protein
LPEMIALSLPAWQCVQAKKSRMSRRTTGPGKRFIEGDNQ